MSQLTTIDINQKLKYQFKVYCKQNGLIMSTLIEKLIHEYLIKNNFLKK